MTTSRSTLTPRRLSGREFDEVRAGTAAAKAAVAVAAAVAGAVIAVVSVVVMVVVAADPLLLLAEMPARSVPALLWKATCTTKTTKPLPRLSEFEGTHVMPSRPELAAVTSVSPTSLRWKLSAPPLCALRPAATRLAAPHPPRRHSRHQAKPYRCQPDAILRGAVEVLLLVVDRYSMLLWGCVRLGFLVA